MAASARGETAGFEELYRRHVNAVVGFAVSLHGKSAAAKQGEPANSLPGLNGHRHESSES